MIIMSVLSVRIDKELEEKLKYLMEKQKIIDKSTYIRKLLAESIKEELLGFLSQEVEKKNMSVWNELAKRDVKTYDESALQEDLSFLEKEGK